MNAIEELGGLNSIGMRRHNYLMFFILFFSILAGIYWWPHVQPIHFLLFICLYVLTGLGVTMGYHRYFTHHNFKYKPWFAYSLLILGTMSCSGPLLQWVRTHWCHHLFTEQDPDPHSPVQSNFWHAHAGYFLTDFRPNKDMDLKDQKLLEMGGIVGLNSSVYPITVLF